jgi:DNA (cytosine-5)-methyltransferase 1
MTTTVKIKEKRKVLGFTRQDFVDDKGLEILAHNESPLYKKGEVISSKSQQENLKKFSEIVPYKQCDVMPSFTFIDLFAGIGGIRLPFQKLGGKCVFTSEWDKFAQKNIIINFERNTRR